LQARLKRRAGEIAERGGEKRTGRKAKGPREKPGRKIRSCGKGEEIGSS